mmetsp:Transcript_8888/g.14049  ORF Transcript_8888/g.14049 Transcript_8888/m.14049 type:complete len:82 (+) Transcript_8888:1520-1765(+)
MHWEDCSLRIHPRRSRKTSSSAIRVPPQRMGKRRAPKPPSLKRPGGQGLRLLRSQRRMSEATEASSQGSEAQESEANGSEA